MNSSSLSSLLLMHLPGNLYVTSVQCQGRIQTFRKGVSLDNHQWTATLNLHIPLGKTLESFHQTQLPYSQESVERDWWCKWWDEADINHTQQITTNRTNSSRGSGEKSVASAVSIWSVTVHLPNNNGLAKYCPQHRAVLPPPGRQLTA